ncbi:hypothetical protein PFFCH_01168 [Plasmodium falciparum FCH/4]|uniref:Uncharacterized protein n=1 Tax=Plasmodium falciparum FCH/4 TaxID=1036724 RepID=A0A024VU06_PLAFA|nr:hypothetical protein PFFCH_01168 [Plasmodium falciparum FCH/4]
MNFILFFKGFIFNREGNTLYSYQKKKKIK